MIFKAPRSVRHQLLHTLVFSSVLALDGCAGGAGLTPTPQTTSAPSEVTVAALPSGSGSSSGSGAAVAEDPEVQVASGDPRYCERGWPTTKAGTRPPAYHCTTVTLEDGTEREECSDEVGPCVLR
ncbi:MAG: hypothetical protein H6719_10065 [Sandaracinaceae bacterium]|nr:hypothetical protein [Sandaracinaceae bacterium]